MKIQYAFAWAPDDWIDVMDGVDPVVINVNSTELQVALVNVNITQAIHIRIIKTSGGNPNIDNIIVNFNEYVDDVGPEINGTQNFTITEGDDLDPMLGVTARDIIEGDKTAGITYIVRDSTESIIDPVDFTILVAGSYTIEYSVTDTNDNLGIKIVTLTIETVPDPPDPEDPLIYSTGFEAAQEFTAGSTYNNTSIKYDGPAEQQWGTYYGTASTTSPISGSMSMQMRWYTTAPSNLGYTFTHFNTSNVGSIKFLASNTLGLNVEVSISTASDDSGWTESQTFTLTGTATEYTYNVPLAFQSQSIRVRFRIVLPDPIPTGTSRLYLDEVKFYIPE